MSTAVSDSTLTGEEIVKLCRQHTIYEWSPQSKADPIPVARAEGVYFYTPEGKRYLDFNSQLMCSNVGHSHPKVVKAIQDQAAVLAYANPFLATEPRARLGAKLAEIAPGDISTFFFTNGGAEANENAIRIARVATGRHKVLAPLPLVPRRHGRGDLAHRATRAAGRPSRGCPASSARPSSTSGRARSRSRWTCACASSRT
jgi:taurine--2-oxoglutarate transaminase